MRAWRVVLQAREPLHVNADRYAATSAASLSKAAL